MPYTQNFLLSLKDYEVFLLPNLLGAQQIATVPTSIQLFSCSCSPYTQCLIPTQPKVLRLTVAFFCAASSLVPDIGNTSSFQFQFCFFSAKTFGFFLDSPSFTCSSLQVVSGWLEELILFPLYHVHCLFENCLKVFYLDAAYDRKINLCSQLFHEDLRHQFFQPSIFHCEHSFLRVEGHVLYVMFPIKILRSSLSYRNRRRKRDWREKRNL